tara:strand:+ start:6329 stop:9436 length:3108 start_codon:yes stop_codon:yes gene_type:complete
MNEPIDENIDQLINADKEVKSEALSINSLNPEKIIENSEVTEDITAVNNEQVTENSVFTGEETKVAGIKDIGKVLSKSYDAVKGQIKKVKQESDTLNKATFEQVPSKNNDFIVTPYDEGVDAEKILKEAEEFSSTGKGAPISSRGKGNKVNAFNVNQVDGPDGVRRLIEYVGENSSAKLKKLNIKELAEELSKPTFSVLEDGMPTFKFKTNEEALKFISKQSDSSKFSIQANGVFDPIFLKKILSSENTIADPKYVMKMLMTQVEISDRTTNLAQQIVLAKSKGTLTEAMTLEFDHMFALMGELSKAVEGRTADIGQSLRMFGETRKSFGSVQKIEMLEAQAASIDSVNRAKKLLALPSINKKGHAASMRFNLANSPDILIAMWQTTWINGLLSSPVTHIKNMASNLAYGLYQVPVRFTASAIGNVRKVLPGFGNQDAIPLNEAAVFAQAYVENVNSSFRLGIKAFKNNKPLDGSASKIELNGTQNIFENVDYGPTKFGKFLQKGSSYWGKFVTMPGRALLGEDEFFKGLGRFAEFKSLANRARTKFENTLKAEGKLSRTEIQKQSNTFYRNILDNPPEDMIKESVEMSKVLTFTKELEGKMAALQKTINENKAMSFGPLLKMVIPFVRTPTNLVTEALKNSPAAWMLPSFRKAILKGGIDADLAIAKMTLGSGAMFTLQNYTQNGGMTGPGPTNKKMLTTLKATGWQPYSFVFNKEDWGEEQIQELKTYGVVTQGAGKIYVSYDGLQPLSTIAGASATIGEYFQVNSYANGQGYSPYDQGEELLAVGAMTAFGVLSEAPQLQGLAEMIGILGEGGQDVNKTLLFFQKYGRKITEFGIQGSPVGVYQSGKATIERFLNPASSSMLPSSNDSGVLDYSVTKFKSRLPYFSNDVANRLDPLTGEEVTIGAGNMYELYSPFKRSDGTYIAGYQTLINWNVPVYVPPYKKNGYELTAEQYNTWIELAVDGGKLADRIEKVGKILENTRDVGLVQTKLSSIMQQSYKNAFLKLQKEYPEIKDFYEDKEDREKAVGKYRFN